MKKSYLPLQHLMVYLFWYLSIHVAAAQAPSINCAPEQYKGPCNDPCKSRIPTSDIPNLPLITITVDIHFVANADGINFQCTDPESPYYAPPYVESILAHANTYLSNPEKNQYGPSPKVPDTRIRYKLAGDPTNPCAAGIFFAPTLSAVQLSNPNALHVVVLDLPPGKDYSGGQLCSDSEIRIFNVHKRAIGGGHLPSSPAIKEYGLIINHEVGHRLGLCHSFARGTNCLDLDIAAECGGPSGATECQYEDPPGTIVVEPCPTNPPPGSPYCGSSQCFNCYCTWGQGNNVMGYNPNQKAFTMYQWAQIYFRLESERPPFAVFSSACDPIPAHTPIVISEPLPVVWDYTRILNRNVEVLPGSTLIIRCEVRMGKDLTFTVHRGARLFIEGGTITSQVPECNWGGILVRGNNTQDQPATVEVKNLNAAMALNKAGAVWVNGSYIINAVTGISTKGNGEEDHGGLVMVDGSDFVNCRRAAEFLRYNKKNNSYFRSVDVLHPKTGLVSYEIRGVSVWACYGIEFDNVNFEKIKAYGISGINFTAVVNECKVSDAQYGFRSEATMPNVVEKSGTEIKGSVFNRNRNDIFCSASPNMVYGYEITNNQFLGSASLGSQGVIIGGESRFRIRGGNVFNSKIASVRLSSTGSNSNTVDCNFFETHAPFGVRVENDNKGLVILRNEFGAVSSNGTEISLTGNLTKKCQIAALQKGDGANAAGNCFQDPVSAISASLNFVDKFRYYVYNLDNNPVVCEKPTNNLSDGGTNNYELRHTTSPKASCPPPGSPVYTSGDLDDARNNTALTKSLWQNDLQNDQKWTDYQAALQHQAAVLDVLTREAFDAQNWGQAETLFLGEGTNVARRSVVGLRTARQDYAGAQALLNTMPLENQDDIWFQDIMAVNFMVAQSSAPFVLSASQDSVLALIANTRHSLMSGYACALLSLCKGYECSPDTTGLGAYFGEGEERNGTGQKRNITPPRLYPNPNTGQFTLECEEALGEPLLLDVFDLSGRVVYSLKFVNTGTHPIQAPMLRDGIYLLRLHSSDRVLHTARLVVAH
jgi:hypothetical protein